MIPESQDSPCSSIDGPAQGEELAKLQQLAAMRSYTLALIDQVQAFHNSEPTERRAGWTGVVEQLQDVVYFLETVGPGSPAKRVGLPANRAQQIEFGQLLRDKRDAAGLSRIQLARKAKLSDATIKFTETGRHPPSRATLIRLIGVEELKLTWADVPGQPVPPTKSTGGESALDGELLSSDLNCYITPNVEPLRMVMDLGRFLNGAGGHVEQTNAYLDHQSAAAYLAIFQQSPVNSGLRGSFPTEALARRIVKATNPAGLDVIALGSGDANLEVRLVQHLIEQQSPVDLRLCLFDVSQPLLSAGFKYATDALGDASGVSVWAVQGNFHHLPLYTELHYSPARAKQRRVYCMLGNTLANVDNEPRFFQHSLLHCVAGDLLVIDVTHAYGAVDNPEEIRSHDPGLLAPLPKVFADWLAGPIYRHCKDVIRVDFAVELDTQCPLPGSYALDAIANVKSTGQPDRRFSVFRFKRHDATKLTQCLLQLGWDHLAALPYGNATSRSNSVMLFCKRSVST